MKALALLLVLSQVAAEGPASETVDVPLDAPTIERPKVCLERQVVADAARHVARLKAENEALRGSIKDAPVVTVPVVVAVAVALAVGVGAGVAIGFAAKK